MIIGVGVDILEIRRLRRALERTGERFTRRVYTTLEREYCHRHRDPAPSLAARFAAKEALFKALGTGWARGVSWQDVEVQRAPGSPPALRLGGKAGEVARLLGVSSIHLSISHSEDYAAAVVVLEKK
jgi:holo-[acyl-carrier protein] synthase